MGSDPLAKFLRWSKNPRGGLTPPPLARLLYEVVEKSTRESDPSEAVSLLTCRGAEIILFMSIFKYGDYGLF